MAVTVAVLLMLLTALLYLPVTWRPVGLYLMVFKVFAVAFSPITAMICVALSGVLLLLGSWWVGGPALDALGAGVAAARVGGTRQLARPDPDHGGANTIATHSRRCTSRSRRCTRV